MENIRIPIQPHKASGGVKAGLRRAFSRDKMNVPLVIGTLLLYSLAFALLIAYSGLPGGVIALVFVAGLPLAYGVIAWPKFGVTVLLLLAYFIMLFTKLNISFPLGTIMDVLEALLIAGFFIKQKYHPEWKIYKNPVTVITLVWLGYNLLQIANPEAESRMAWLFTVRTVAIVMLLYFVFVYHLRDIKFIRFILKLWIALSFFAALYGLKQELFGFFSFEERWLDNPELHALYHIGNHWRIFSIFSDPVAFAYNMVISSILCLALLTGPVAVWKKMILTGLAIFFLYVMLYSGTRGAYVLLPSCLPLFGIMKFNARMFIYGCIAAFIFVCLIFMPTSNSTLVRFQSAFRPSNDASFNVRASNQKKIQPYILSHPIGGGLGSTGMWGQRFSPDSYLANFPPDSGYVRVAVEQGWIGLLIFCIFMFIVLKTGVDSYFKIRDPELKSYCLAMTMIIFALNLGNFPQEALVQFPVNIYFYLAIALIQVTLWLDQRKSGLPVNVPGQAK
jgi:hypothetical protein